MYTIDSRVLLIHTSVPTHKSAFAMNHQFIYSSDTSLEHFILDAAVFFVKKLVIIVMILRNSGNY